jgi:ABC-type Mn2+/Zn2+ transport system ATPase subunit
MSESSLLEAKDLSIGYGGRPLLEGISFQVMPRDFFGLVGPNGAGKSTLLMTLLGSIKPVRGFVRARPSLRIGYVPQRSRIDSIFPMSAIEVVRSGGMGPKAKGKAGWVFTSASKDAAIAALDRVGMKSLGSRPLRDLSGGQQQRVLMARALVRDPDLLILDEPTAGMDIPAESELLDFVSRLNEEQGTAVMVVVHQISLVAGRANRMALINKDIPVFAVGEAAELLTSERLTELYREPMQVIDAAGQIVVRCGCGARGGRS